MRALPDEGLASKTRELRGRLRGGASLDALLPEAFALVREAARRMLGMRHYDVQLARALCSFFLALLKAFRFQGMQGDPLMRMLDPLLRSPCSVAVTVHGRPGPALEACRLPRKPAIAGILTMEEPSA